MPGRSSGQYNAVGMPRASSARVEHLAALTRLALAAHCDQVRAAPMSDDTYKALLQGIAQSGTYGRRAPRKVAV